MKDILTEDIKRINELIRLTEEDNVGEYIDSTYLKHLNKRVLVMMKLID